MMFEVPPNDYRIAAVCCCIWVRCVIYDVVRYVYIASVSDVGFGYE